VLVPKVATLVAALVRAVGVPAQFVTVPEAGDVIEQE